MRKSVLIYIYGVYVWVIDINWFVMFFWYVISILILLELTFILFLLFHFMLCDNRQNKRANINSLFNLINIVKSLDRSTVSRVIWMHGKCFTTLSCFLPTHCLTIALSLLYNRVDSARVIRSNQRCYPCMFQIDVTFSDVNLRTAHYNIRYIHRNGFD